MLFHSVELKNEFLADFCSTVTPQFSSTVATQLFHTSRNSTLWKNFGKWTKSWNIIFHSFSTVFTQMGHTFHILWNTLVFSSVRSGYAILVKICKWLKVLNSVPFIKKTLVNHVYIRIWWSWLTFTVLQRMKKNSKISQFSSFLLRYAILVKIWKWLKLLNSVPFIKKTLVNKGYIRTWSFWLTFTVSQ